jgi:hypothetical protein
MLSSEVNSCTLFLREKETEMKEKLEKIAIEKQEKLLKEEEEEKKQLLQKKV